MNQRDEEQRSRPTGDWTGDDASWAGDLGYAEDGWDATADDPEGATPAVVEERDGSEATGTIDQAGIVLLAVLVVLALLASIIMLFTDSATWMKVAVLAGLWAAVVGAVLTTRYRRKYVAERDRIGDLERRHQLELEKEEATHREQELLLEQNYLDSLDADRDDLLQELRAEIAALREHLAELTGQDPDDERIALRARAERLRELGAPTGSIPLRDPESFDRPAPRVHTNRAAANAAGTVGAHTQHGPQGVRRRDADEPVDVPEVNFGWTGPQPVAEPGRKAASEAPTGSHRRTDGPAPAGSRAAGEAARKTDSAVADARRSSGRYRTGNTDIFAAVNVDDASAGRRGHRAETPPVTRPHEAAAATSDGRTGRFDRTERIERVEHVEHVEPKRTATPKPAAKPKPAPEPKPAEETRPAAAREDRGTHGRRRAEDHAGGLTVAELLAQMRKEG